MDLLIDGLLDALIDSAKLIPFLLVIYILLEFIDRRTGTKIYRLIRKADKFAPLLGGAIGVIPQCGLSAAAATLYSGKVISVGTMLAVFLSASDDMLPILLSEAVPLLKILKILGLKLLLAVVSGYIVDLVWKLTHKKSEAPKTAAKMMSRKQAAQSEEIEICTASCCKGKFWVVVLKHTAQVFGFIFAISFLLNLLIGWIGEDRLGQFFQNIPVLGEFIAALIGLIPNCASSVVITELYLSGVMSAGALFAGLLVNAGVGTLVLLRSNKDKKETFLILGILYFLGVFWGIVLEILGVKF